jgi:hypothetical protein
MLAGVHKDLHLIVMHTQRLEHRTRKTSANSLFTKAPPCKFAVTFAVKSGSNACKKVRFHEFIDWTTPVSISSSASEAVRLGMQD